MNNMRLLLACGMAGSTLLSGCALSQMVKMAKDQQLTVKPSPLELHGDSVAFEMSAKLPVKMLKKNKKYAASVTYAYNNDQKTPAGEVVFDSKNFPNAKKEEPVLKKRMAFAYTGPEMDRGELLVKGTASNINDQKKETTEMPLPNDMGKGVITTARLVQPVFTPAYADHNYNPATDFVPTTVEFFFEQNSAKLRVTETGSGRGKFLQGFIAQKNETNQVIITGMHSPEGTEARNTVLAEERAKAIEGYYRSLEKKMAMPATGKKGKKAKGKAAAPATPAQPPVQFITRSVVQNWNNFRDSLAVWNGISDAQKKEVNDIIGDGKGDFMATEAKLAQLPYYDKLLNELYPRLRTARTEIITKDAIKTDAEIALLAKRIAEGQEDARKLSDKQLAYAATLTPLLEEREAIYKAASKKNDSWQSHNNLGAVYLEQATRMAGRERQARIDQAMTQFKIAANKQQAAEVQINMAVAQLLLNNSAQAAVALQSAGTFEMSANTRKVINSLNGATYIRAGRYDEAINLLNNSVDKAEAKFNRGLAYLMKKDHQAAGAAFTEALTLDPKFALAHYGNAIIGARTKNESQMNRSLEQAIKADEKLRARAIGDMEFYKYWNSNGFKQAVR